MQMRTAPELDGLRRRQAWLRWRYYLVAALLTAVVFGGPYLIISTFGWRIWTVALCIGVIAATHPLMNRMPRWTAAAREARGEWLFAVAHIEERPPVLILRSFRSATTVAPEPTLKLFGKVRPVNQPDSPAAARSHVLGIAEYAKPHGPVVAIGKARRGVTMTARVDALMLDTSDEIWFAVFEALSAAARAVVVLPGETDSLATELRSLRERDLIAKVILVMPPHDRPALGRRIAPGIYNDNVEELESGWQRAQAEFRKLGISLPTYDKGGLAFTVDAAGNVKDSVPLEGSFVRLDRGIRELVPEENIRTKPLAESMKELDRLGLDIAA